jgi:hypothetical protein
MKLTIMLGRAAAALPVAVALIAAAVAVPGAARADGPYGPDTCLQGYVWREAFPGDHVCVTPETRSQAAMDNAQASSRTALSKLPYGPDTCKQGFVWRDARAGDHVCVTPTIRSQAAADNAAAASRVSTTDHTYGPDTCKQGFVWREAFAGDHVCVIPATRTQAAADNAAAATRTEASSFPYGPDTCAQGYVWRDARPGDHVCVTPEVRAQAAYDNSQADARRAPALAISITADRAQYSVGDTVRICYTVPGAGEVAITDTMADGYRQILLAGADDGTGGCIMGVAVPPLGRECVRLDFAGAAGSGYRETCFTVTL